MFHWGLGAEPPRYLIVDCQNWNVLVGWRYDFWDIVDTISELAKPYKNVEAILKDVLTVSVSLHCQYRYQ